MTSKVEAILHDYGVDPDYLVECREEIEKATASRDDLTTGEWMVLRIIEAKIADFGHFGLSLALPTIEEIDDAINGSNQQTALGEFVGAAWDTAEEIVYDMFPQFREENFDEEDH